MITDTFHRAWCEHHHRTLLRNKIRDRLLRIASEVKTTWIHRRSWFQSRLDWWEFGVGEQCAWVAASAANGLVHGAAICAGADSTSARTQRLGRNDFYRESNFYLFWFDSARPELANNTDRIINPRTPLCFHKWRPFCFWESVFQWQNNIRSRLQRSLIAKKLRKSNGFSNLFTLSE